MTSLPAIEPRARPLRSLLFVPGNDHRKVVKALGIGTDAVVLDLEDAVAAGEKDDALRQVIAHVEAADTQRRSLLVVRVNALPSGRAETDLVGVVGTGLDAVLLPKVESATDLVRVDGALRALESVAGLPPATIGLLALIETAHGLAACEEIARAIPSRLMRLVFGSADFTTDVGLDPRLDQNALLYARARLVVASRAAGLPPPLDGPFLRLDDEAGLRADSVRSRGLGFGGRVAIHPAQLTPVHEAYGAADVEQRARAERVVVAFDAARQEGRASIRVDGEFVDEPIYQRAMTILGRAPSDG